MRVLDHDLPRDRCIWANCRSVKKTIREYEVQHCQIILHIFFFKYRIFFHFWLTQDCIINKRVVFYYTSCVTMKIFNVLFCVCGGVSFFVIWGVFQLNFLLILSTVSLSFRCMHLTLFFNYKLYKSKSVLFKKKKPPDIPTILLRLSLYFWSY